MLRTVLCIIHRVILLDAEDDAEADMGMLCRLVRLSEMKFTGRELHLTHPH